MKLIVNAISIFKGGGKHVLDELLLGIKEKKIKNVMVIYDNRYEIENKFFKSKSLTGNIFSKFFKLIILLKKIEKHEELLVLSLNSIPLPYLKSKQWVLFQNRNFLLECLPKFKFVDFIKACFFHIILKQFKQNLRLIYHLDETLIRLKKINDQCTYIKASLINYKIKNKLEKRRNYLLKHKKKYKFITITSNTLNKKNYFLLNSWKQIHEMLPNLSLTIIGIEIKDKKYKNLNIKFYKYLNWNETQNFLLKSDYLIFNSTSECLGLPLVEAESRNINVIAPDLDFVWEVLEPYATYDPKSKKSLIRAIFKSVGARFDNRPNFISGLEFLKLIEDKESVILK